MPASTLYPWHYQMRWPLYFFFPSTRNRTRLRRRALSHEFFADAGETLRMFFIGDIMVMHHDVVPKVDPAVAQLLSGADFLIGNCESPVLPREPKPDVHYNFTFDMAEDFLGRTLAQLGVPPERIALSVSNNHSGDQGEAALSVTIESMRRLGVTPFGAFHPSEPPVTHFEARGLRFGAFSWSRWMNQEVFGSTPGVWRTEQIAGFDFAEYKRREGLDLLVAFPHWEYEFQHFPHKETRQLARRLNEQGVRLIVGCHAHVLQPVEWFEDGICAYSVGNFCGQGVAWPVKLIPILEVHVGLEGGHRGRVVSYKVHCFVQLHDGHQISIEPLDRATPERQRLMNKRLRKLFEGVPPLA